VQRDVNHPQAGAERGLGGVSIGREVEHHRVVGRPATEPSVCAAGHRSSPVISATSGDAVKLPMTTVSSRTYWSPRRPLSPSEPTPQRARVPAPASTRDRRRCASGAH
jgi:hypothetical protein